MNLISFIVKMEITDLIGPTGAMSMIAGHAKLDNIAAIGRRAATVI